MFKPVLRIVCYMFVGGVACWAPDVTIHLLRGYHFSRVDVLLVTLSMPACAFGAYLVLITSFSTRARTPSVALFMLIGIWLLGSLAMMIGATPTDGGFSASSTWAVIVLGLLPPYTFIMATYDASLAGLAFTSIAMLLLHVVLERHHWILPRRFMLWLRLPAV